MKFRLFAITDVGMVRDHNEDNFAVCKDLSEQAWNFERGEILPLSDMGSVLIVADGMGGTNSGEIASDIAQKSIKDAFSELKSVPDSDEEILKTMSDFIIDAHNDIVEYQNNHLESAGMGTTAVIGWVLNDKLYVCWSGDSRAYVFNPGSPLFPLTDDHSQVWNMVKAGQITPEEARVHPESNLITQNLGDPHRTPSPDGKVVELSKGDRILVCSDGLNGMLSDADMHYLLLQEQDTSEACKHLVAMAKQAGGHDNITLIMMDIEPGEKAEARTVEASSYNDLGSSTKKGGGSSSWMGMLGALVIGLGLGFGSQWLGSTNNDSDTSVSEAAVLTVNVPSVTIASDTLWAFNLNDVLPFGPEIIRTDVQDSAAVGDLLVAKSLVSYQSPKLSRAGQDQFSISVENESGAPVLVRFSLMIKAMPGTTANTIDRDSDSGQTRRTVIPDAVEQNTESSKPDIKDQVQDTTKTDMNSSAKDTSKTRQ